MINASFIRDLCGLSTAELPDEVIANLYIIPKVVVAAKELFGTLETIDEVYPTKTALDQLDYMGYKAVTLLKTYIMVSVPQTIKDNYNSFTRFDNLDQLFEFAESKVALAEGVETGIEGNIFQVVSPSTDPVTEG